MCKNNWEDKLSQNDRIEKMLMENEADIVFVDVKIFAVFLMTVMLTGLIMKDYTLATISVIAVIAFWASGYILHLVRHNRIRNHFMSKLWTTNQTKPIIIRKRN